MSRCIKYLPKGGDILWLGVKAGMARVWWQVKLLERFRSICTIKVWFHVQ